MKEYCFVIQPYNGGDFDNRFDDMVLCQDLAQVKMRNLSSS